MKQQIEVGGGVEEKESSPPPLKPESRDDFIKGEMIKHRRYLFRLAYILCGNESEAQDLVQETFYRALRGLPRFRGRCKLLTWLHRILVNTWKEEVRKRVRRPTCRLEEQNSKSVSFSQQLEDTLTIREVLTRLPEEYRMILILREVEGFSYIICRTL